MFQLSLGAAPQGEGRTRFRVWAPDRQRVELCLQRGASLAYLPLERSDGGYFEGTCAAGPGDRYRFRLDGGDCLPDPSSRSQPEGPHGPSVIVDPLAWRWRDDAWGGVASIRGQVIYELHVGTFTPEGTFGALARELPDLKELGATILELMPLHGCPGRFNWGYDGASLFAPPAAYGTPEELKALVDGAHRLGLGVILDVVYNHLGPDGNYLGRYAKAYFSDRYPKEWGDPIDFEGAQSGPVRDFFIQNACYWVSEYHFDGLRVDATQSLYDASPKHFCAELAERVRAAADRPVLLVAESEPQDQRCVRAAAQGGYGFDAVWVDDFHHAARVAATGMAEAYLGDYRGTAQELVSCVLRNALFQGQWYGHQQQARGTPLREVSSAQVVFFLQNHDQVANSLRGLRLHQLAAPAMARALTVLHLLAPQTPHLFMGQEYFASTPFLYFVDHEPELQRLVQEGREAFLCQFPSVREGIGREGFHPPIDARAFELSQLRPEERAAPGHREARELHRALLALRREDPVFARQDATRIAGAILAERALVLRYTGEPAERDRLVIVNLDSDLAFTPCPEPLLAPAPGTCWEALLSSESTRFGGCGATAPDGTGTWLVPGRCALVLRSRERTP